MIQCFLFLLKNGLTPLHIAAHYGHVDIAELLLNRSADTDARARVRFINKSAVRVEEVLDCSHSMIL